MKNFEYKILNPGGNKTALVLGNNYSKEERKTINDYILNENKDIEQVGFISKTENKLEMAGGEFCVNATRCAIYEYAKRNVKSLNIKVSGYKEIIEGSIDNEQIAYAKMKIVKNKNDIIKKINEMYFVYLDGILLAVINEDNSKELIQELKKDEETTKMKLKEIMKDFKTTENAVGIILLENDEGSLKINPIIWVKTVDTLYYETACGSGSLATAIYKNYITKNTSFNIEQPSGYSINVKLIIEENYIKEAIVSGKVMEEGGIKNGRI